jgi:hypothetical protein
VLKTENWALASALVAQVANRALVVLGSEQCPEYVARIRVPAHTELHALTLSLDLVGPNLWEGTHLIRRSLSIVQDDHEELLMVVTPKLLTLVDLLGKKATQRAISQGLVLRKPLNFRDELENAPSRCDHLPSASPELIAQLEMPPGGVMRWSRTVYKRDNF